MQRDDLVYLGEMYDFAVGMRNILAHNYLNVDYDVVFTTAPQKVPELIATLAAKLPPDQS
jgi:uncharacterized protein with HEPN domain